MTAPWPVDSAAVARDVASWADAIAIGPGLGQSDRARTMLEGLLRDWRGPVVLDADALNIFAGRLGALAALLDHRAAILTPHAAEFARLAGCPVADVLASRFEIGQRVADRLGAVVLLKGTPTVVFAPGAHAPRVSASGTPALATAGSGDVLTGIAVTLLAQMHDAADAAACAAWVHGRAAELAQFAEARRDARGVVLDDVLHSLPEAWRFRAAPPPAPVLVELPAVERAP
jgi:NAD(P)H-hydrate epimerase